jgi:hypothetical protein
LNNKLAFCQRSLYNIGKEPVLCCLRDTTGDYKQGAQNETKSIKTNGTNKKTNEQTGAEPGQESRVDSDFGGVGNDVIWL